MNTGKILVVDDEPQLRRVMRAALSAHGYAVMDARNGEEALVKLREEPADLVLLDLNMPGIDGMETCRVIRSASRVPIVVLSVRSSHRDKVKALDVGADDYVTKPFDMEELLARIRAALRRAEASPTAKLRRLSLDDLDIDFETRRVKVKDTIVRLTPKEFDLLRCLVAHAGEPVPHRKLLQTVWGPDYGDEVEYLHVLVNQLRKKIEPDPGQPRYVVTEPWIGYSFVLPPTFFRKS